MVATSSLLQRWDLFNIFNLGSACRLLKRFESCVINDFTFGYCLIVAVTVFLGGLILIPALETWSFTLFRWFWSYVGSFVVDVVIFMVIYLWSILENMVVIIFQTISIMTYMNFKYTAQKTKFSIKDFFSKCYQIRRKLQIWSYLLKKP